MLGIGTRFIVWFSGILVFLIVVLVALGLSSGEMTFDIGIPGGSFPIYPDYDDPADRALVEEFLALAKPRRDEAGRRVPPRLDAWGFFEDGQPMSEELQWQEDEGTGQKLFPIDERVLRTILYLAGRHAYLAIGGLRQGAPVLTVSQFQGGEPLIRRAAFYTGQGLFIKAVDFSERVDEEGLYTPIDFDWQKYRFERHEVLRSIYDELTAQIAVMLKDYLPALKIAAGNASTRTWAARRYLEAREVETEDKTSTTLEKARAGLQRIKARLGGALQQNGSSPALGAQAVLGLPNLDEESYQHFQAALEEIRWIEEWVEEPLVDLEKLERTAQLEQVKESLRRWGGAEVQERFQQAAREIFRGTQVANMKAWQKSPRLDERRAYEARTKIRQVLAELLAMPRETGENGEFNRELVARQIITYAPEDDLDNGLPDLDIYPKGVVGVERAGIIIDDTEKDGKVTSEDEYFSHLPMDLGIFSLSQVWLVFLKVKVAAIGVPGGLGEVDIVLPQVWLTSLLGTGFTGTRVTLPSDVREQIEEVLDEEFEAFEFSYKHGIWVGF